MKTLFERLKPEYIEKIARQFQQYPNTIIRISNDLKKNKFIDDLHYGSIVNIGSLLFDNINIGYFEIANLFEDDI